MKIWKPNMSPAFLVWILAVLILAGLNSFYYTKQTEIISHSKLFGHLTKEDSSTVHIKKENSNYWRLVHNESAVSQSDLIRTELEPVQVDLTDGRSFEILPQSMVRVTSASKTKTNQPVIELYTGNIRVNAFSEQKSKSPILVRSGEKDCTLKKLKKDLSIAVDRCGP